MKSNAEWIAWGEVDPLFAVATWPGREKDGPNPWTEDEFYGTGAHDWRDVQDHWTGYGLDPGHCLELGCGAGRITRSMAPAFQRITAVDVSVGQISSARQRVQSENLQFVVADCSRLPIQDEVVTAIFSVHLFQHFDSLAAAESVLRETFRVLQGDGTFLLHFPLYGFPQSPATHVSRLLLLVSKRLGHLRAAVRRWRKQRVIRFLEYDRDGLLALLHSVGFYHLQTRGFYVSSNGRWRDIILGTKRNA